MYAHSKMAFAASAILMLASCTVKEDRSPCPCLLQLEVDGCRKYGETLGLRVWNISELLAENIDIEAFTDCVERDIPKGDVTVGAFIGIDDSALEGRKAMIPTGSQSDSLYAYREEMAAYEEYVRSRVVLHKQFATLTLHFKDNSGLSADDLGLLIEGNTGGLSLEDLSPVEGEFSFSPKIKDGKATARLPRQKDDSLKMTLLRSGEYVDSYDLGRMISTTGYDWGAPDLKDIDLEIDLGQAVISISLDGWDEGICYSFKI